MKITPSDITNKTFKKSIRGYDADEVDEFLDLIVKDYEGLYKDNSSLKEKIDALSDQLERFLKMENTIQNTLVLAQDASENAKQAAQKEADLIVKTAKDEARKTIDTSQQKAMMISRDFETLKQDFFKFKTAYRNFMTSQLELFNSMEKDMTRNYEMLEKNKNSNINTYNYVEEEYGGHINSFEIEKNTINSGTINTPYISNNKDINYISDQSNLLNKVNVDDSDYIFKGLNDNISYHELQNDNNLDNKRDNSWENLENISDNFEKPLNNSIYSINRDSDDSDNDINTYKDFQYTNYNNTSDLNNNEIQNKQADMLSMGNVYPITRLGNLDEDELTNVKDENDDIKSFEA